VSTIPHKDVEVGRRNEKREGRKTYLIEVIELVVQIDRRLHVPLHIEGHDTGRLRPHGVGILHLAGLEERVSPFPVVLQGVLDDGV
jgi:hypothetical protein